MPSPASTLRAAAQDLFAVGVALPDLQPLSPARRRLAADQFNALTAENEMKPYRLQATEGCFSFAAAEALVQFAKESGMQVQGHTLLWHEGTPPWFFQDGDQPAPPGLVRERLLQHIATVAGRFRGHVRGWDVVNEAIDDGAGYLRDTPWLKTLGAGYIEEAFRAARRADPEALLFYNDYSIERPAKRAKTLRLLRDLTSRGAPLDGVGIQGHWLLQDLPLAELEETILSFQAEGLLVAITELDLDMVPRETQTADAGRREVSRDDPYAHGCPPELLDQQAQRYAELFRLLRRHADAIDRVTFWGLDDGTSWLNHWPRARTNHPLLWDRKQQPKPAFDAVLQALRRTD